MKIVSKLNQMLKEKHAKKIASNYFHSKGSLHMTGRSKLSNKILFTRIGT